MGRQDKADAFPDDGVVVGEATARAMLDGPIGAVAFLVTCLTLLAGTWEESVFGYGFLPGVLALLVWSFATSLATYRALATTARP